MRCTGNAQRRVFKSCVVEAATMTVHEHGAYVTVSGELGDADRVEPEMGSGGLGWAHPAHLCARTTRHGIVWIENSSVLLTGPMTYLDNGDCMASFRLPLWP